PTARRVSSIASRLPGTNRLGFQPSLALSERHARAPCVVQCQDCDSHTVVMASDQDRHDRGYVCV
ncbi:MAG: hypothetical protein ABW095_12435, partial [Candidatus Thiodiazotropha sp.]